MEVVATQDIPDSPPRRVAKRKKVGKKPPRPIHVAADEEMEDAEDLEDFNKEIPDQVEGSEWVAGPGRVGNYSITEISKMMSGIPSKPDWAEMERSRLNVVMQKCTEHWRQLSISSCNIFHLPYFFCAYCF